MLKIKALGITVQVKNVNDASEVYYAAREATDSNRIAFKFLEAVLAGDYEVLL